MAARSASAFEEVVVENWGLSELVEPAVRTGRTDLATEALSRLAMKARATGTGWALGIEARSRALVSHGDAADALFRNAIEHLSRTRVRAELGRAHLLYGEWLRGEGRRVDARGQLLTAHELFNGVGMDAFAERARVELLAAGARVHARTAESRDRLTPQEEQIARLARRGTLQSRDQRATLPESTNGRVASPKGLRETRDRVSARTPQGPAGPTE